MDILLLKNVQDALSNLNDYLMHLDEESHEKYELDVIKCEYIDVTNKAPICKGAFTAAFSSYFSRRYLKEKL